MNELNPVVVEALESAIDTRIGNAVERSEESIHPAQISRIDKDGSVWVRIFGSEEDTPVKNATTTYKVGDTVSVRISKGIASIIGNYTQPAIGMPEVNQALEFYQVPEMAATMADLVNFSQLTQEIAEEAMEAASAVNQHFWNRAEDPGGDGAGTGAFVTDIEKDEFLDAAGDGFPDWDPSDPSSPTYKPYMNSLWNSLGMFFRTAKNNLVSITKSAISFFDGEGNSANNIIAHFGKNGAQIGKSSGPHIELSANGMLISNGSSTGMVNGVDVVATNTAANNANTKVDNLQVGGRNLVWDTEWNKISDRWTAWGAPPTREIVTVSGIRYLHIVANAAFQGYQQNQTKRSGVGEVSAGDKIMVSYTAYAKAVDEEASVGIHWRSSSAIISQSWCTQKLTTTPTRYTFGPFTVPNNAVAFNVMVGAGSPTTTYEVWVGQVMVEKGTKASNWTPAPEDAENAISEVNALATAANTLAVSVNSKIDGLEIGGRNLLIDSDAPTLTKINGPANRYISDSGNTSVTTAIVEASSDVPVGTNYMIRSTATSSATADARRGLCFYSNANVYMVNGEQYTLSCYARLVSGSAGGCALQYGVSKYPRKNFSLTSNWTRISWTFTYNDTDTSGSNGARIYFYPLYAKANTAAVAEMCGFKLEKGNRVSDWTLAPEDLALAISVAEAQALAELADGKATTTAQNFWADPAGVHVSTQAGTAAGTYNSLFTSTGLLFRKQSNNLISLTPGALNFYDGSGNATANVVASFGTNALQIGKYTANHVYLDANAFSFTSANNNDVGINSNNNYIVMNSSGQVRLGKHGNPHTLINSTSFGFYPAATAGTADDPDDANFYVTNSLVRLGKAGGTRTEMTASALSIYDASLAYKAATIGKNAIGSNKSGVYTEYGIKSTFLEGEAIAPSDGLYLNNKVKVYAVNGSKVWFRGGNFSWYDDSSEWSETTGVVELSIPTTDQVIAFKSDVSAVDNKLANYLKLTGGTLTGGFAVKDNDIGIRNSNIYRDIDSYPSSDVIGKRLVFLDGDLTRTGTVRVTQTSSGMNLELGVHGMTAASVEGSTWLSVIWNRDGTKSVLANGVEVGKTTKVTDYTYIIVAASGVTVSEAQYAQYGKVASVRIIAKPSAAKSGTWNVGTMGAGKRPAITIGGIVWANGGLTVNIGTGGLLQVNGSVAANTSIIILATYVVA